MQKRKVLQRRTQIPRVQSKNTVVWLGYVAGKGSFLVGTILPLGQIVMTKICEMGCVIVPNLHSSQFQLAILKAAQFKGMFIAASCFSGRVSDICYAIFIVFYPD
jgi:hypothetical protein